MFTLHREKEKKQMLVPLSKPECEGWRMLFCRYPETSKTWQHRKSRLLLWHRRRSRGLALLRNLKFKLRVDLEFKPIFELAFPCWVLAWFKQLYKQESQLPIWSRCRSCCLGENLEPKWAIWRQRWLQMFSPRTTARRKRSETIQEKMAIRAMAIRAMAIPW